MESAATGLLDETFATQARTRRVSGIDVGGTFTDLVIHETDPDGPPGNSAVRIAKVPTTVENQAFGVLAALAETGISLDQVKSIVHGTTATTNAMLERKIA